MRCPVQLTVMVLVLLASVTAWTQQDSHPLNDSSITRFSYNSSWPIEYGDKESPQICFALQEDGDFQMRRLTSKGTTELVGGTVPAIELKELKQLLETPEFRSLTSSVGGLIFSGGESFVAELSNENGVHRIFLANPDRERPFPPSAAAIISWLQQFTAEGSKPLDVSKPDICPAARMKLIRPSVASLEPGAK